MITSTIEKFLQGIDQATFQKMMNHLLHLEGNRFIASPGAVVGRNKTSKGTPDSFFETTDGYAFCEMTTQEKLEKNEGFFNKLMSDIDHCFDTDKSKIEKDQIKKVMLCFTEKISVAEHNQLKAQLKKYNPDAVLTIYSIQEIPFRLLYYPGLADRYIPGIKTTKGSIYTLSDFIDQTKKGIQPSLDNPFVGREEEIKNAVEKLQKQDMLVLTGNQGVGKSKFAIRLAEIFEQEYNYEPRIINSSPVPLWDDLSQYIYPNKKYFILFDDANRALNNLEYLIEFIKSRPEGHTKVVITVRDYARKDLNKNLMNVAFSEIELLKFGDKKISEIIDHSLPEDKALQNLTKEKIVQLAKGNSRLALMATTSIIDNDNIDILKDVFSLYDRYFQAIKTDLNFLADPEKLKALGILSFFTVLDRNNQNVRTVLETKFKIDWDEFWEIIFELERAELVDIFYNESAKISDQVLATYVFFKTFIAEDSPISYPSWVHSFISTHRGKISSTITDTINTFGYNELEERMTSLIIEIQNGLGTDRQEMLDFLDLFWFYRQMDCLVFTRQQIEMEQSETIPIEEIKFVHKEKDYHTLPYDLTLLAHFWGQTTNYFNDAIELTLQLMFKRPSRIPEILKHLKEHVGIRRYDYLDNYLRQHTIVGLLIKEGYGQQQQHICDQIFLAIAPTYINWAHNQYQGNGSSISIHTFRLVNSESLMSLRGKVLTKLLVLFDTNQKEVLEAITYSINEPEIESSVIKDEQPQLVNFINEKLDENNYAHSNFVCDYIEVLENHSLTFPAEWSKFTSSKPIELMNLFSLPDLDSDVNFELQEETRKKNITDFIKGKDIGFISQLFDQLSQQYQSNIEAHNNYWIDEGIPILLIVLSRQDTSLFCKSLELIMTRDYHFPLNYANFISIPVEQKLLPASDFYDLINRYNYSQKQFWKQIFFEALNEEDVDEFYLKEYVGLIQSASGHFSPSRMERYIKFQKYYDKIKAELQPAAASHQSVITFFVELMLNLGERITVVFDHNTCQKLAGYFNEHLPLFKALYFHQSSFRRGYDHTGSEMMAVSNYDHSFIIEYLEWIINQQQYNPKLGNLNSSFIWSYDDHAEIVDRALELIIARIPYFVNLEHEATKLFKGTDNTERQTDYISSFIRKNSAKRNHIRIIFNIISYRFNDKRIMFLREFLLLNKDIDMLKHLWIEKNGVFSGSRVPRIERKIEFIKKILQMVATLPDPLSYADHVKHWENELEYLKQEKREELRNDFKGNDY